MESRHCGQDKRTLFCPVRSASTPSSLQAFGIRCMLTCLDRTNSQLNKSNLSHARRLIYISRIKGVVPKQSAFERLLFRTKELEQSTALQLNELKKFHEKWRDLKFAEPEPRQLENIFLTLVLTKKPRKYI